ncbi:MAG: bacillithiol biosynthesis BshC, partial [Gemmatimonadota bacterium]|nr:bacillithiol biosynthesis BshC [Gemmatimonadota bacterium]
MITLEADRVPAALVSPLVRPVSIGGSQLVRDYLAEVPSALQFYAGSPHRISAYREKLAEVDRVFTHEKRIAAAGALLPTSASARERLDRFVREGGVAVTTGQQTGFLTGPLYTIYKAVSAAVLAEHLEKQLGRVVLPIFWSASEDHDWAEVDHTFLLDPRGGLCRFRLPAGDPRPLPMSRRQLEEGVRELTDEIRTTL